MIVPWLPPGTTSVLPGRGEVFYRHHTGGEPGAPTLLLLHGWTASGDLQFFTAYEELGARYPFVAIDHRGHGRGMRAPFTLEDAADDAAALVRELGVGPVITVGYSMGGPVSMHLAHRHPGLVSGMVLEATALEWRQLWWERLQWRLLGVMGAGMRSRFNRHMLHAALVRLGKGQPDLDQWFPWLEGEVSRNDVHGVLEAGRALARHDARPFARTLGKPAGVLLTSQDHLVRPRKQRELIAALNAEVRELRGDHLCMWVQPADFSRLTLELVDHVAAAVEQHRSVDEAA